MNSAWRPIDPSAKSITRAVLCALLVGATIYYLQAKPLFLCLWAILSGAGFFLVLPRGAAAIRALCVGVLWFQVTAVVAFLTIAAYHRMQAPPNLAGVPLPRRFALPPWDRNFFFAAAIVVLGLFTLESNPPPESGAGKPGQPLAWAILPALVIQGALMHFWSVWEIEAVVRLSSSTSAPMGRLTEIAGVWLFGSRSAGFAAAEALALTSILTLVGASLVSVAACSRAVRRAAPAA